jgi:Rhodanese-related sulfurtransferase
MGLLSIFGFGQGKLKSAIRRGAIVIDVRTATEFDQGKVPHSINIPVDRLAVNVERIRSMKRPIIFVCASGHRSGNAVRMMKEKGIPEVYNGGNWESLLKLIKQ